jgi:gluconolactonase
MCPTSSRPSRFSEGRYLGAVGPDGKPWTTREGVRNTAMTIYKISMLAEGFKGRPK